MSQRLIVCSVPEKKMAPTRSQGASGLLVCRVVRSFVDISASLCKDPSVEHQCLITLVRRCAFLVARVLRLNFEELRRWGRPADRPLPPPLIS